MQDAVRQAVVARLHDLQDAARRLEQIITAGDAPGLLLARAAVDVDTAASQLADHAAKLEAAR